jgi:hypothetical protein
MNRRTWDGTTPPDTEADPHVIREAVSFLLGETGLDRESRSDGGLYAFVDDAGAVVIRNMTNTARWAFTNWAAVQAYVDEMCRLAEQGVTQASALDRDRFEAILLRKGAGRATYLE